MPEEITGEAVAAALDVGSEVAGLGADVTRDREGRYPGCSGCLLVVSVALGLGALVFYFWR